MPKPYDLILYGATGFVGQQAIAYLAKQSAGLRWAIAGRSEAKLLASRKAAGVPDIPILVADAQDSEALTRLAGQTRVVLSCAGPYAIYGNKLVAACVAHQTHYCDITGETPWIRKLIDTHHAQAEKDGTRIVPSCGFDSVPSDLGVYLVQREMLARHGEACTQIKAAFTVGGGGLNGGTLASVMNMIEAGEQVQLDKPFLLNPAGTAPPDAAIHKDPLGGHWDADFNAWLGLFVMGPVNTRVVRRSAALREQTLHYQEYMRFGKSPVAGIIAGSFGIGSKIGMSLLSIAALRKIVQRKVAQPGQGPTAENMDRGFFKIELVGTSNSGKKLRGIISDQLDAGNRATVKMMCESALALALDEKKLPVAAGVITPSVAFGDVLEQRLLAAGMRIEVTTQSAKS